MKEHNIEDHLVKRVRELGGEVRKVKWIGRRNAPDRLVMVPPVIRSTNPRSLNSQPRTLWVELKNPETILTFPADAHERAQAREHKLMRDMGQRVEVIGTIEQIESLLS